jgi:hypothetical protein
MCKPCCMVPGHIGQGCFQGAFRGQDCEFVVERAVFVFRSSSTAGHLPLAAIVCWRRRRDRDQPLAIALWAIPDLGTVVSGPQWILYEYPQEYIHTATRSCLPGAGPHPWSWSWSSILWADRPSPDVTTTVGQAPARQQRCSERPTAKSGRPTALDQWRIPARPCIKQVGDSSHRGETVRTCHASTLVLPHRGLPELQTP